MPPIYTGQNRRCSLENDELGVGATEGIGSDISAFPKISQLGDLYQSYMTDQMNQVLPGFSDIMKTGAVDTQEMLTAARSST